MAPFLFVSTSTSLDIRYRSRLTANIFALNPAYSHTIEQLPEELCSTHNFKNKMQVTGKGGFITGNKIHWYLEIEINETLSTC